MRSNVAKVVPAIVRASAWSSSAAASTLLLLLSSCDARRSLGSSTPQSTASATACERTVAKAAPATPPFSGAKIKKGSAIALTIAAKAAA